MNKLSNLREQGSRGESQALALLEQKGYRFVGRNYHCRWGEIDLIMLDRETLVFIEVKLRKSVKFGSPLEAITRTKQRRLIQTAQHYLLHHPYQGPLRFDFVGISQFDGRIEIQHLENAMDAGAYA